MLERQCCYQTRACDDDRRSPHHGNAWHSRKSRILQHVFCKMGIKTKYAFTRFRICAYGAFANILGSLSSSNLENSCTRLTGTGANCFC
ncbi:unnamed protein product [Chondrus crispus]|uniref:Uncharacterized protein n=1 Tax=Chondrus crispus TaxID=2769 RepID=R7Q293_CHOCR|nr:unnamed protein product [Chondrus crispus]CDF32717.1 unnamed protein product [Chondrus crispus]|eukprot:XP_005712488.1 unnamed protein product [Chondrus crispus]